MFTEINWIIYLLAFLIAVALGGYLCFTKIDFKKSKSTKKTSNTKKSKK